MTTTIGACGRCGGAMIEGHDIYGRYSSCVTCGHLDDQDAKPMNVQTLEELGEGQHSDSERTTATVDITIIQYPLIHSAVPRFTPVKFRAVYRVPTLAMQKRGIRYELLGLTRTKYGPYPDELVPRQKNGASKAFARRGGYAPQLRQAFREAVCLALRVRPEEIKGLKRGVDESLQRPWLVERKGTAGWWAK